MRGADRNQSRGTPDSDRSVEGFSRRNESNSSGQSDGQWNIWEGQAKALNLGTAGGGVAIKEGANARQGVSTLVGGTVDVANTSVTANTRVDTFRQEAGGTLGHLSIAKNAGVGFTINSSSATETSNVGWVLFEPS